MHCCDECRINIDGFYYNICIVHKLKQVGVGCSGVARWETGLVKERKEISFEDSLMFCGIEFHIVGSA